MHPNIETKCGVALLDTSAERLCSIRAAIPAFNKWVWPWTLLHNWGLIATPDLNKETGKYHSFNHFTGIFNRYISQA
ncbi:MAG: hypothetical protein JNK79_10015 [Chitinophagaceae bacterium]|nr:hypothetical protein [Chitinophagaceae bacterium]